jgi:hypothetical protein
VSTAVAPSLTPTEALERLNGVLDLSKIRTKLADVEEGKGYSDERLDSMEAEYRKFLALHLAFPDDEVVPCKMVDEMWHQHILDILDTHAYEQDCDAMFGRFLHHFPYFGMRGEDDARALCDAYADTIERYCEAFGEPPEGTWISQNASSCKRTACKPQKCR